ncbi:hypothetical protein BJ170DRAFT_628889 [Xylariales sp. AK1849]|nr:hypothetical protein BJ170DRAFT_628889 [Xylariales sp. AK1849]
MEPPAKRARVGHASYDNDDEEAKDDELSLTMSQFDARQDPMYQLDKSRARSAFKLKSRFEDIFAKYEKDFDGVGDEIDLRTGEVIVNNGHLESLEYAKDKADSSADEDEEERILQGKSSWSKSMVQGKSSPYNAAHLLQNGWEQPPGLMSSLTLSPQSFGLGPPIFGKVPIDPQWQTPELQQSPLQSNLSLGNRGMSYSPIHHGAAGLSFVPQSYGGSVGLLGAFGHPAYRRITTVKDVTPKSLPAPTSAEEDGGDEWDDEQDDDDILMGTSRDDITDGVPPQQDDKAEKTEFASHNPTEVVSNQADLSGNLVQKSSPITVCRRGRPRKKPIDLLTASDTNEPKPQGVISPLPSATLQVVNGITASKEPSPNRKVPPLSRIPASAGLAKQLVATKVRLQQPTPASTTDDYSDSQSRRSSRSRKQTEFYGQINWLKMRQKKKEAAEPVVTSIPEADTFMSEEQAEEEFSKGVSPDVPPQGDVAIANIQTTTPMDIDSTSRVETLSRAGLAAHAAEITVAESQNWIPSMPKSTIPDSEDASSPMSTRIIADSEGPSSSLLKSAAPEVEEITNDITQEPLLIEIFSRNQLDPSYTFSDEESDGEHQKPYLSWHRKPDNAKAKSASELMEVPKPEPVPKADDTSITADVDERKSTNEDVGEEVDANVVETPKPEGQALDDVGTMSEQAPAFVGIPNADTSGPTDSTTNQPNSLKSSSPKITCTSPRLLRPRGKPRSPKHELSVRPSPTEAIDAPRPVTPEDQLPEPAAVQDVLPSLQTPGLFSKPSSPELRPSPGGNPETPKKKSSPAKPSRRGRGSSRHLTCSAKKSALASLVPDNSDDEDELSIILSSSAAGTPTSFRASLSGAASHQASCTPRRSRKHSLLVAPQVRSGSISRATTPSNPSHRSGSILPHTDIQTRGQRKPSTSGLAQSSPLARCALENAALFKTPRKRKDRNGLQSLAGSRGGSPTPSLVRTPGGTMRRCGEDGFVCDRDFCFTCCK